MTMQKNVVRFPSSHHSACLVLNGYNSGSRRPVFSSVADLSHMNLAHIPHLLAIALCTVLFSNINPALSSELPDEKTCNSLDLSAIDVSVAGWCLMILPRKGNCLICHHVSVKGLSDGLAPSGNIGPILNNISTKYPDHSELVGLLNDPSTKHPNTIMPPYGKHRILSQDEIEAIAAFLLRR